MAGAEAAPVTYDVVTALRHASFEVATMMTDCGFVLVNYDNWPVFSQLMLFLVTMTGGCVGSTAGGFKILRLVVLYHVLYNWLERSCHPKLVTTVRVNKTVIEADVANRVMFFLGLYVVWMTIGIFFMSFAGLPFEGAVTSVIATMNNCGPGLGVVGPTTDYSDINTVGTIYLTVNMLVGRLEMVTFLVLLLPSFWRRD
jgi:trk system potassium uptake protein TrkH